MTNPNISQSKSLLKEFSGAKCTAPDVARGVSRLLVAEGYSPVTEFTLGNGRRLDVAGLNAKGEILGGEDRLADFAIANSRHVLILQLIVGR